MRQAFEQLQVGARPTPQNPKTAANQQALQPTPPKEPRVNLLEKFDGTRSKFWGFVNHIRLVFRLQPRQHPTGASQVGLIGTLLSRVALSWFVPLLKKNSLLLKDLDDFLAKFNEIFGETDRVRTATAKLHSLRQGARAASVYTADFRQLACEVDWDDNILINAFRWGLRDNVKDLLLNLPDPVHYLKL